MMLARRPDPPVELQSHPGAVLFGPGSWSYSYMCLLPLRSSARQFGGSLPGHPAVAFADRLQLRSHRMTT
jgi:hypothetical protein